MQESEVRRHVTRFQSRWDQEYFTLRNLAKYIYTANLILRMKPRLATELFDRHTTKQSDF